MNTHKENILIYALMSVMAAVGSVAFICGIMGIEFREVGLLSICGFICGLSGLFFGVLLFVTLRQDGNTF